MKDYVLVITVVLALISRQIWNTKTDYPILIRPYNDAGFVPPGKSDASHVF